MAETETQAAETAKATCKGVRKDGEPCAAWQQLDEDGFCRVHSASAKFDPVANGRAAGIRSGEVRREAGKSVRQRMADELEAEFELVWNAYKRKIASEDPNAYQGADAALNQAFGKPVQPTRDETAMIFSHPLLTAEDVEQLNNRRNGGDASFSETPES